MYCGCCKNSRTLFFREHLVNEDESNFLRVECNRMIKGSLYCKAYNKIIDSQQDEYCERSISQFDD